MNALSPHFSVMKLTAIQDYDNVKRYCIENNLPTVERPDKGWQKIEDATAQMLYPLFPGLQFPYYLNRGTAYYKSIYVLRN